MRQAFMYPGEDGWWVAEVPSLPGALSQGQTREEAIQNIKEAVTLVEEIMHEQGESIPAEHFNALFVAVSCHHCQSSGTGVYQGA